jgi:hypothetical protein
MWREGLGNEFSFLFRRHRNRWRYRNERYAPAGLVLAFSVEGQAAEYFCTLTRAAMTSECRPRVQQTICFNHTQRGNIVHKKRVINHYGCIPPLPLFGLCSWREIPNVTKHIIFSRLCLTSMCIAVVI